MNAIFQLSVRWAPKERKWCCLVEHKDGGCFVAEASTFAEVLEAAKYGIAEREWL